jgi:hypothetical protein
MMPSQVEFIQLDNLETANVCRGVFDSCTRTERNAKESSRQTDKASFQGGHSTLLYSSLESANDGESRYA